MAAAGILTVAHDLKLHQWLLRTLHIRKPTRPDPEGSLQPEIELTKLPSSSSTTPQLRRIATPTPSSQPIIHAPVPEEMLKPAAGTDLPRLTSLTWKSGLAILLAFLVSFVVITVTRNAIKNPPRGLALFGNMYLAGTIIFGGTSFISPVILCILSEFAGGPVVIPLLRDYVVSEGWVSSRDFLLGLAIIQAFPGPNFNFAVFLGSLAVAGTGIPSIVGALIGFLGIFTPGIAIATYVSVLLL